jgi:hypothetical protein
MYLRRAIEKMEMDMFRFESLIEEKESELEEVRDEITLLERRLYQKK